MRFSSYLITYRVRDRDLLDYWRELMQLPRLIRPYRKSTPPSELPKGLPIGIIALGVTVLFFGAVPIFRSQQARSWPVAEGRITSSRVHDFVGSRGGRQYSPKIEYLYSPDGLRHYRGTRITFGDYASSTRNDAESILSRYPVGSRVPVFYDPRCPRVSVLEPTFTLFNAFFAFWGTVVTGVGVYILTAAGRARRQKAGQGPPASRAPGVERRRSGPEA